SYLPGPQRSPAAEIQISARAVAVGARTRHAEPGVVVPTVIVAAPTQSVVKVRPAVIPTPRLVSQLSSVRYVISPKGIPHALGSSVVLGSASWRNFLRRNCW